MSKTALITGASSGIGTELAKQFAADKINLVLVARRRERLEKLALEIKKDYDVEVDVLAADLTDGPARQQIMDTLQPKNIVIDYLVNNAGFGDSGPYVECDWEKQQQMIALNITALSHLTRLLLPGMVKRKTGGMLNVASTAGFLPGPYMSVYYASKAYVLNFTEAIAEEVAGYGIKVSALCPGPVVTEFQENANIDNARMVNRFLVLSAEKVARIGYEGFKRGKVVNISGLAMKFMIHSLRTSTRAMIRKTSGWMTRNN